MFCLTGQFWMRGDNGDPGLTAVGRNDAIPTITAQ